MSKFYKVEVSRKEYTDLYLVVDDDFKLSFTHFLPSKLSKAIKATISDGEWMDEDEFQVEGWEEASQYLMYDLNKEEPRGKYWRKK